MELKLIKIQIYLEQFALLIVPYGIETSRSLWFRRGGLLLIVPYGIETWMWMTTSNWKAFF